MLSRLALVAALAFATPALAEQPSVGDLFDAPPSTGEKAFDWKFRGWTYHARGTALGMGRFVLFKQGSQIMVAATEVMSPSKGVGHDGIQKITATKVFSAKPGEEEVMFCDFVTLSPALAFYDKKTGIARGVFVVGEEISEQRWFTTVCHNGE